MSFRHDLAQLLRVVANHLDPQPFPLVIFQLDTETIRQRIREIARNN